MNIRGIFAIALTLVASDVIAANWVVLSKTKTVVISADLQSLKINSNERTIWIKFDFFRPQKLQDSKKTYYDYTTYETFDCHDQTTTTYEALYYDRDGNVVNSIPYHTYVTWEPVVPDTLGDTTITGVCAIPDYKDTTPAPPAETASPP
jgi:hypothetical protein